MSITSLCLCQLLGVIAVADKKPSQLPSIGLGVAGSLDGDVEGTQTAVEQWLRLGGRHVDTALMYRNGQGVREGLRRSEVPRSEVFLTSKIPPERMGYQETLQAVADVLDELGVATIDCLLIHWPGRQWAMRSSDPPCVIDRGPEKPGDWTECRQQSWVALRKAQQDGSVRYVGVSNYELAHLAEMPPHQYPQVLQVEFHPWWFRRDLLAWCQEHGVKMVAYSSLGGPGQAAALASDPTLGALARRHQVPVSKVLLHWAVAQGVSVIPSARSEAHMRENLDCCSSWHLSAEEIETLSSIPSTLQQRTIHPDPRFIFSSKFHAGDPGPMPLSVASVNLFGAVDTITWLGAGETSCWHGPYQHYPCCAADFGAEGLQECWIGEFTFARCCISSTTPWSLLAINTPGAMSSGEGHIADFVVVGAGSAGSVVAGRLATQGFAVTLLDSGGWDTTSLYTQHPNPSDPAQASRWFATTVGWLLGGVKRELQVITGRALGGSSAVNGHIYTRTPLPFEQSLVKLAYESIEAELTLLYMGADAIRTDGQEHFAGEADATSTQAVTPQLQHGERMLLEAFRAAGVPYVRHGLDSVLQGIGPILRIVGCHGRWGPSSAYQCSAKPLAATDAPSGGHIQVAPGHHADKLVMDGSRAVGVRALVDNGRGSSEPETRTILARKEVILAAGALSTPLLLARSGIGSVADLRRIGVPAVVRNEHIGFKLQDHPYLAFRINTGLPCNVSSAKPRDLFAFYSHLRLHDAADVRQLGMPPEVELQLSPSCATRGKKRSQRILGYKAYLILLKSRSSARVLPRSSNALDPPQVLFDPFAGEGNDAMALLRQVQDIYHLLKHKRWSVSFEPPESVVLDDSAAQRWCAETLGLWQHPGGTAQVEHVLNDRLEVLGTEGLRVADASAVASPQGHPDAAIRAVGHMAAHWAAAAHV